MIVENSVPPPVVPVGANRGAATGVKAPAATARLRVGAVPMVNGSIGVAPMATVATVAAQMDSAATDVDRTARAMRVEGPRAALVTGVALTVPGMIAAVPMVVLTTAEDRTVHGMVVVPTAVLVIVAVPMVSRQIVRARRDRRNTQVSMTSRNLEARKIRVSRAVQNANRIPRPMNSRQDRKIREREAPRPFAAAGALDR